MPDTLAHTRFVITAPPALSTAAQAAALTDPAARNDLLFMERLPLAVLETPWDVIVIETPAMTEPGGLRDAAAVVRAQGIFTFGKVRPAAGKGPAQLFIRRPSPSGLVAAVTSMLRTTWRMRTDDDTSSMLEFVWNAPPLTGDGSARLLP